MSTKKIPVAALGLFVLLSLIWGYNWVVMKKVMRYADPFDFSAVRTLFGALALFAVLMLRRKPLKPVALGQTLLLGLLQTTAFTALIQWALVSGGAGKTAVLVYAMPFWLLPMAWVFLGERVRGVQWLAVTLALVGLVFILDPWKAQGDLFSTSLALLASVSWAASAVLVKRIRARFEVDLLSLTAWQMLLGSVVLCAVAWLLPSAPPQLTTYFVVALIYNALLATGLAWLIWLVILDRLPAGLAGLASLAVPAVGVLAGWIELGERPSAPESFGMVCIAFALVLISAIALRGRELQARVVSAGSRS